MKKGWVALIGAGPGEISLLTLKGKEYIEKADVVVFDRLVSKEILGLIPSTTKKIDVGKQINNHLVPQDQINKILLTEASEGNNVVRLKGGDPFLFGRGGEELELLIENNISFEVVPGVTSAISAPSYAGIPVTHRDFCSSVHIITGHQKENEELKINFSALTEAGGTLVFLMGVSSLKQIMNGLINANMNKNTPAAIIENGTSSNQRKLISTIENLYEKSIQVHIKSPSIIVVGKVCELSDKYDWFSKLPLFGKKIVVTRPKISGNTLSKRLKELGATVYDFPCIEIEDIIKNKNLEKLINSISEYKWLVFTSKNGVEIFFSYLRKNKKDLRLLANIKIAAIGNQTAKCLDDFGIIADFVPKVFDGLHLGQGLSKIVKKDEKILLLRALKGNEEITDCFKENNLSYLDLAIYDTHFINEDKKELIELMQEDEIDYVTLTSASTVEGFVKSMEDVDLSKVFGICIGNHTAAAAKKYGIKHIISKEATIDSMIEKLLEV